MFRVARTLDGLNSTLDIAEEKTGDFEDIAIKTIKNETKTYRKKLKLTEHQCALGQLQEGTCVCVCVCVCLESLKERRGKDKNI